MVIRSHRDLSDGRYTRQGLIGSGSTCTVYLGYDRTLKRKVAIKQLNPNYALDSTVRERFSREARLAASLNHPNIVTIHDTSEEKVPIEGHRETYTAEEIELLVPYIVMEYVKGLTLKQHISNGTIQNPSDAIAIVTAILSALACAHDAGIVHRDIKPANIMIRDPFSHGVDYNRHEENPDSNLLLVSSLVKVMDFGIAFSPTAEDNSLTTPGSVIGSVLYMSPERLIGDTADTRSDLYSVGAVLYELLTRRPPFTGSSTAIVSSKHLLEAPEPPSTIVPQVSARLDQIVLKALEKDPKDRYQSAGEMRRALLDEYRTGFQARSSNSFFAKASSSIHPEDINEFDRPQQETPHLEDVTVNLHRPQPDKTREYTTELIKSTLTLKNGTTESSLMNQGMQTSSSTRYTSDLSYSDRPFIQFLRQTQYMFLLLSVSIIFSGISIYFKSNYPILSISSFISAVATSLMLLMFTITIDHRMLDSNSPRRRIFLIIAPISFAIFMSLAFAADKTSGETSLTILSIRVVFIGLGFFLPLSLFGCSTQFRRALDSFAPDPAVVEDIRR